MNKIAILGDSHFGVRGDNIDFHNYFQKFYDNIFFPYLIEHGIKNIYQVGDLFDRRKFINFNSLYLSREYFFNRLEQYDIRMATIIGNHDAAFKNTLKVNSPELLLKGFNNIDIHKNFKTVDISGIDVDLVPWICEDNRDEILENIRNSKSQICFGHFEINGFEMDRGNLFKGGQIEKSLLSKYEIVLSGHFHHKSDDGHIFYVGTPTENTWSDYNDPRGFHIFDLSTRSLEFIQNPYQMFHKITYDDAVQDSKYWQGYEFETKKDTYIKIVSINKNDPYLFDTVVDSFYKAGVCDIGIVEDFTELETQEDDVLDQAEDTLTSLNKHIDTQDFGVDVDKLKTLMREIYVEALNIQKSE